MDSFLAQCPALAGVSPASCLSIIAWLKRMRHHECRQKRLLGIGRPDLRDLADSREALELDVSLELAEVSEVVKAIMRLASARSNLVIEVCRCFTFHVVRTACFNHACQPLMITMHLKRLSLHRRSHKCGRIKSANSLCLDIYHQSRRFLSLQ
jgi:hypothetical protein